MSLEKNAGTIYILESLGIDMKNMKILYFLLEIVAYHFFLLPV